MEVISSARNFFAAARTASSSKGMRTSPLKPALSATSTMFLGRTGRSGLTHDWGFTNRGVPCRPISSTNLKPSGTTSPTGEPLFSRMALVAMVVPWKTCLTCDARTELSASTSFSPVKNPVLGSSGVDGVLCTSCSLVVRLQRTMSVNVPPTSTATE